MQISSVIVPESNLDQYLDYIRRSEIPTFEAAPGLASVRLLQRHFVAYVEVMTISMWRSEEALTRFTEVRPKGKNREYGGILLEPHTYQVILDREIERPDIEFDA